MSSVTLRRSSTWIRCTPKRETTGADRPPTGSAFIACLELRHHDARRGPAEFAAGRGRAVLAELRAPRPRSVRAPLSIWRRYSASRRAATSALSCGEVRSRMWRARVCVTWPTGFSRRSSTFRTWKPAPVRSGSALTSPGRSPRVAATKTSGRRDAGRRPISPPRSRLPSSETSRATASKASPPRTRASAASMRARRRGHGGLVGAFGHGDEDLREVGLGVDVGRAALLLDRPCRRPRR